MQDQNSLKFDSEKPDNTNSAFSTENSLEVVTAKEEKPSRYVAKNQKIYSINDAKNFEELYSKTNERLQLIQNKSNVKDDLV